MAPEDIKAEWERRIAPARERLAALQRDPDRATMKPDPGLLIADGSRRLVTDTVGRVVFIGNKPLYR